MYIHEQVCLQEGRTALHYAALNGFAECVQLIAAEGCEIDLQDNVRFFLSNFVRGMTLCCLFSWATDNDGV